MSRLPLNGAQVPVARLDVCREVIGFLRDRLDEDEDLASAHLETPRPRYQQPWQPYLKRWQPERVLLDVEARRRLVETAARQRTIAIRAGQRPAGSWEVMLRVLALTYLWHPDWSARWSPGGDLPALSTRARRGA